MEKKKKTRKKKKRSVALFTKILTIKNCRKCKNKKKKKKISSPFHKNSYDKKLS